MEALERQILDKMKARGYSYFSKSFGLCCVYSFCTPLEDKVRFACDVRIRDTKVTFKFKKIVDNIFQLTSSEIGSFFDDEHFNEFEARFLAAATWCQVYDENNRKGE